MPYSREGTAANKKAVVNLCSSRRQWQAAPFKITMISPVFSRVSATFGNLFPSWRSVLFNGHCATQKILRNSWRSLSPSYWHDQNQDANRGYCPSSEQAVNGLAFPACCTSLLTVCCRKRTKDDEGKRQNAGKQYRTPNQSGKIRAVGNDCIQLIREKYVGKQA